MSYQNLLLDISDKMALISLNNPPSNSLKMDLLKELETVIGEMQKNAEVKVIILTGAGKLFASGADILEISQVSSREQAKAMAGYGQKVFTGIENSVKPVMAAINGFCLGGGLELAMSCHFRIASDRALMGLPEITLGIIPGFGGTQRLPRLIGKGKALQMILTGEPIRSDEALALGLVNAVVPKDQLLEEARNIARKITSKSALSIAAALKAVVRGCDTVLSQGLDTEAQCFSELYGTDDMKEGLSAHLEKRKPNFADR